MKHKKFLVENRRLIIVCDVMVALIIIFNVGALVITNMMVVKVEPKVEFAEANPAAVIIHNYKPSEPNFFKAALKYTSGFFTQAIFWGILICCYLLKRSMLTTMGDLKHLIGLLVLYLVFTGLDFFNNFGFLLGRLIYGG